MDIIAATFCGASSATRAASLLSSELHITEDGVRVRNPLPPRHVTTSDVNRTALMLTAL